MILDQLINVQHTKIHQPSRTGIGLSGNILEMSPSLVILGHSTNVQHTKNHQTAPWTGIGLSGKILENIKCFLIANIPNWKIWNNIFFFKFGKFAIEKDRFYSNHIPKFEIYELTHLSNLWKKSIKKNIFFIFQNITALPYSRPGGGGGNRSLRWFFVCCTFVLT